MPRRASEVAYVGSFQVTACVRLDWSDSNHPATGWTTTTSSFYVTDGTLPEGAEAIITSDAETPAPEARLSSLVAPAGTPKLSQG